MQFKKILGTKEDTTSDKIVKLTKKVVLLEEELSRVKSKSKILEHRVDGLQTKNSDLNKALILARTQVKDANNRFFVSNSEWKKRLKNLENLKKMEETKERSKNRDNLQLIKGVGKVLEKVLNDLGVYQFEQIASWSAEDILKIDKHISFPGRVEREEWVRQATGLVYKKRI